MRERAIPAAEPRCEAEYQAAIDLCLTEIRLVREKIDQEQAEIDRLKAETRALLAELKSA